MRLAPTLALVFLAHKHKQMRACFCVGSVMPSRRVTPSFIQFCLQLLSCCALSQLKTLGYCRLPETLTEEDGRCGIQAALRVAERLYAPHGLVHKDFRWHNLLWAGVAAKPFIIDFELATQSGQEVRLPTTLPPSVQLHTR